MSREPIYRTIIQVEIFSRGPYKLAPETDWLTAINYDITEGDCIGDVQEISSVAVVPGQVEAHLLRIGNDGTFFGEDT